MSRAADGVTFTNFTATPVKSHLYGGRYGVTINSGTWGSGGTITPSILGADGTTVVPVMTGFTANGYGNVDLPDCELELVVTGTITNGNASVWRIVGD